MSTPTIDDVADAIRGGQPYQFTAEKELQDGIERVLVAVFGDEVHRECRIGNAGRLIIDFLVGGVGVEVKVKGSPESVARQLVKYSNSPMVSELLLVSTVGRHINVPELTKDADGWARCRSMILTGGAL